MLKIRLRRVGKTKKPYYRVVVAQNEKKRDGAFLEILGSYDPHANPPAVTLDGDTAREWMSKGAQPSEAAEKVLRRAGVITTPAPERKQPAAAAPAAEAKPAAAPKAEAAAPAAEAEAPAAEVATAEPVVEAAAAATPPAAAEAAEESAEATEPEA